MNNQSIRGTTQCLTAGLALALLAVQATSYAGHGHDGGERSKRVKHIRGYTVTGVNSIRGKPFFHWGGPYGDYHFPTTFVYNPGAAEPTRIDQHTPDSAVLATGVSPEYLLIRGEPPEVVKPEWVNVPLRKVPVNIDFDPALKQTTVLRSILEADPLERPQSVPAGPITLGQWMKASGNMTIRCVPGGGADIKMRVKNLVPNRIYSIWATMGLPDPGSGIEDPPLPIPIGGTPSVIVTDANGDASLKRWMQFCPLDPKAAPSPMLTIELLYHANHSTYGAIPAPGIMLGLITFPHILFPVTVELMDN